MIRKKYISPAKRSELLHDKFGCYAISNTDWKNVPKEARDRISKAFDRLIESIIDIDDDGWLSIDYIFDNHIRPLIDHAIKFEKAKQRASNKSEKNPKDKSETMQPQNEISREKMRKKYISPAKRLELLYDKFADYAISNNWKNVPAETKYRLCRDVSRIIKSLDHIDDIELLSIESIDRIFDNYIRPIVDRAIKVEEYKLSEDENDPEEEMTFVFYC